MNVRIQSWARELSSQFCGWVWARGEAWDQWALQSGGTDPRLAISLFRWMFGLTYLVNVSLRAWYSKDYFGPESGVPAATPTELLPEYFRPLFSLAPETWTGVWIWQSALLVSVVLLILGVGVRWMALAAFLAHSALMQKNYSIVYGADIVSGFFLFALIFMGGGQRLKPLRPQALSELGQSQIDRLFQSVGWRMLQVQLCVIYAYTGFEKLKGREWWDQTALWQVLGNEQLMMFDLSFLRAWPALIGLLTWGTVVFEIYAPLTLWWRSTRKWTVLIGWGLHFGIGLTMGLWFFSLTMMSAYLLFLDAKWLEATLRSMRRRRLSFTKHHSVKSSPSRDQKHGH